MENGLLGKTGTWKPDGSEGFTLDTLGGDSSNLRIGSASKGTPFNCCFVPSEPLPPVPSSIFFEITVAKLEGHLAVGLVLPSEFHPGWRTRGMFYNGNLTNGSAAKRTSFGESIKQGSTVGVLYLLQSTSTHVYFFVDQKCLGLAFALPKQETDIRLPCLHVSGSAEVNFRVPVQIPMERQRSTGGSGYAGDWKLEHIRIGPELGELQIHDSMLILGTLAGDNLNYRFSLRIVNTLRAQVRLTGRKVEGGFDEVGFGMVGSTMMMGDPASMLIEKTLSENIPHIMKMIRTGETLLMIGPTIELQFQSHIQQVEPLASYQ